MSRRGISTRAGVGALLAAGALALGSCGGGDEESDEGDLQAFCDMVAEVGKTEDPLTPLVERGNVEQTQAALQEAQAQFGEIADVAPGEIRADVEDAQQFLDDFIADVQGAERPEEFLDALTGLQEQAEEFEATGQRLDDYTAENCEQQSGQG